MMPRSMSAASGTFSVPLLSPPKREVGTIISLWGLIHTATPAQKRATLQSPFRCCHTFPGQVPIMAARKQATNLEGERPTSHSAAAVDSLAIAGDRLDIFCPPFSFSLFISLYRGEGCGKLLSWVTIVGLLVLQFLYWPRPREMKTTPNCSNWSKVKHPAWFPVSLAAKLRRRP